MSETPMSMTVGPVTIGGKSFLSVFGGMKESAISRRAQVAAVPMIAPYASGHGSWLPAESVLHIPLEYI